MCAGTLILSTLKIGMNECLPPVAGCLSPYDLEGSDAGSGISSFRKQLPQEGYISCMRCSGSGKVGEDLNLAMETGADDGHSDYWL
jgi:hypothetical protein